MSLRTSAWTYDTAATAGAGVAFVAAAGGHVFLKNPAGQSESFWYGGVGVGASLFRIPRIPDLKIKSRSIAGGMATQDMPSFGKVYMTPAFAGSELKRSDFQGATVFVDGGGGLIVGWSGTALLVGIDATMLALGLSSPALSIFASNAIAAAPAVILMTGMNIGAQAGAGIAGLIGYLR